MSARLPPSFLFLLLLSSACPLPSRAQDAATAVEVPEIDVTGDPVPADPTARESSQASTIEGGGAVDSPAGPAAAVRAVPAVLVRESGGAGQSVSVSIRGSDPRSTLVTLDGIPLNSPFMGGADLNSLGLVSLGSIDIVRGGQGAARGNDAAGGAVDARTPSVMESGTLTRAVVSGGSSGTFKLKASHSHLFDAAAGATGVMASAGVLHSGGGFRYTDSNGVGRDREHNASTACEALIKVESEAGADHRVDALVEFWRDDREVAGMDQFPSATAVQDDTRVLARVGWRGPRLFGLRGATSAWVWGRFLMFNFSDPVPYMGPPQDTGLVSGGIGAGFSTIDAPIERLALRLGIDGGYEGGRVRRVGQPPYSPGRGAFAGTVGLVAGAPADPWQVSADVRLEYDSGSGFRAVPALGVWYEPHPLVRLSANAGRSFRLPTLEELYFDTGFVQGNPALEPEDSIAWDVGIEVGRGRWFNVKAAYFENYGFNLITFQPVSAFVIRAANSGSAVLRGVEASGSVQWRWFKAGLAYTWLFSEVTATGNAMPARPEHVIAGELAFSGGPFRLALMPSWQSGFFLDAFESVGEEGRFRLDVRLEVRPKPFLTLALDLLNITDKSDSVDFLQQPLPGFSAFGSVVVEL